MSKGKLLLIDGHSILSRAFYGMPMLTNSEGKHLNAVYGFLTIMFKVIDEEGADHFAVAFDVSRKTFRNDIYAEYKGTRKPMPEELHEQVPLIQDVLRSMNIPILTMEGFEADDILGTVAKRSQAEDVEVTVLSGDRDLLQLADEHIKISIPKTSKGHTEVYNYYPEDVKNEWGVSPTEFIDVKALMGDASDNIPGVPSIGEKTAKAIIAEYKSIENAFEHLSELKPPRAAKALAEHFDMAQMSKVLATINTHVPIDFSFDDAEISDMYNDKAVEMMKWLEFKSLLPRFQKNGVSKEADFKIENLKTVEDKYLAELILKDAKEYSSIGFKILTDIHKKEITGLSLSLCTDRNYVIRTSESLAPEILTEGLKELFFSGDQISKKKFYTTGLKSQLKVFPEDLRAENIYDLEIAAYLINPLKDSYDYEDLARDYMKLQLPSKAELLGKTDLSEAFSQKKEEATAVMAYESAVSLASGPELIRRLKEMKMESLYRDIELPLIYCLNSMEVAGIKVDRESLKAYADLLKAQTDEIEASIYEEVGEEFNINSPKQLGEILFGKLKIKGGKKTKTGYSTAADVLQKLAPDYPVVNKILRYRTLTKLYSTYAVGLDNYISDDGRIHGTFNQTITATGRISSTDPNLQNIPVRTEEGKEIRKVFVAKEGCVFADADYSQVELRILASMSGDEKLINAYKNAVDIHSLTASEVFHTPIDEVTPEMRRNAKAVNFGIVYGISAFGLGEGLSIDRKEAQNYINKYFETYPKVKEFLDSQVEHAREKGYVLTQFNRLRPIPEIKSSNFMQRSFGERVAMNSPIQGTAADIMKIAMAAVDSELRKEGLKSRIVLQVHDELLVECPEEEADRVCEILKKKMEDAAKLKVKLIADVNVGRTWYDCH